MAQGPLRISILGSTGSVGTQVLDVVRRLGPEMVEFMDLTDGEIEYLDLRDPILNKTV